MSPGPDLAHQDLVGEIFVQVFVALRGKPCRAFIAPLDVSEPDVPIGGARLFRQLKLEP